MSVEAPTQPNQETSERQRSARKRGVEAGVKPERRPLFLLVAFLLAIVSALLMYFGFQSTEKITVLAAKDHLKRGQEITANDLTSVEVDRSVTHVVPVEESSSVIGSIASVDLLPGTTIVPEAYVPALGAAQGKAVVGVGVSSQLIPVRQLVAGDPVKVVYAPQEMLEKTPSPIGAVVQQVRFDEPTGRFLVELEVAADDATTVLGWAANEAVGIVLEPHETAKVDE